MGMLCNYFVPAAILLDNPGVDIFEFDQMLNSVGGPRDLSNDIGCNKIRNFIPIFPHFHNGIFYTCSNVLGLDLTHPADFSSNPNDPIELSGVEVIPRSSEMGFLEPGYRVVSYMGQRFYGDVLEWQGPVLNPGFNPGDGFNSGSSLPLDFEVFDRNSGETKRMQRKRESARMVVREVVSSRSARESDNKPLFDLGDLSRVLIQDIRYQNVLFTYDTETFGTYADLIRRYPRFSIDRNFDLTRERGDLYTGQEDRYGKIFWVQRNKKLYLDLESILQHNQEKAYTSIALTAEAIRHKDWEVLGYWSGAEIEGVQSIFYLNHPDSVARHMGAVLDFYDYRYAVRNGLSLFDLIGQRARGEIPNQVTTDQLATEMEHIKDDSVPKIERMIQRQETERRSFEAGIRERENGFPEDECPF